MALKPGLLERLRRGPVICAEGYLFELERRGLVSAGAFVPEVVLSHPEAVRTLHREFVHAGSDVVEAFTYYAHREKLRLIGKEDALEEMNRGAIRIAKEVAAESDALVAGDICNTNVFVAEDPATHSAVRAMFEEQVGWAAEEGVDFIIAETFSDLAEARIALEVMRETGLPTVVTMAIHRQPVTRDGLTPEDCCKALEDAGADVVGLNCARGPATMLPLLKPIREAVSCHVAALPVPYRTHPEEPTFQSLTDHDCQVIPDSRPFSRRPRSVHLQPFRDRRLHHRGEGARRKLFRRLLRRRRPPHPQHGRGVGPHPACQRLFARHVQTRLLRHRFTSPRRLQGLRQGSLSRPPARRFAPPSLHG